MCRHCSKPPPAPHPTQTHSKDPPFPSFSLRDRAQAGGVGQIKPCPRPLQEYVTLMTDLMALDTESGRLVKKSKGDEGVAGSGASAGGGSGAATPPGKQPRRKPRQSSSTGIFFVFLRFL